MRNAASVSQVLQRSVEPVCARMGLPGFNSMKFGLVISTPLDLTRSKNKRQWEKIVFSEKLFFSA
jgi:hypothetical protein